MVRANPTCAVITPSFRTDFEQARLLSESVQAHVAPHVRHYFVVDRRDASLFAPLRGPRTDVFFVEDVVPWWILRLPFARRWWLSLNTLPIRNWMLQQIVKLSVVKAVPADVLLFVDSDVFFTRPFDPHDSLRDGNVPLYREHGEQVRSDFNTRWHNVGSTLFGLPKVDVATTSYVGNIITWRSANVYQLHDHIEKVTGRPWIQALSRLPVMSEYVLYGIFCEHILKDASGHYFDPVFRSHCYWGTDPLDVPALRALRRDISPEHLAVMISAKSRTPIAAIRQVFGDLANASELEERRSRPSSSAARIH
jgi:Family of unknown function (DUF6492)